MSEEPKIPATDLRTLSIAGAKVVRAQRRAAVTALLNRGYSLREAAEQLGITFGQVAVVHRALVSEAEKAFTMEAKRHRARLLHKNLLIQRECWEHLERARAGHVRQELEEPISTNGQPAATGEKVPALGIGRKRTMRENDLMAEARILETLRKAQADEAKILGLTVAEEEKAITDGLTINDNRTIVITNNAEIPATAPWVASIPKGYAKQGVGLLPPGSTLDAEIVEEPKP